MKEVVVRLGGRLDAKSCTALLVDYWTMTGVTGVEAKLKRIRFEDASSTCCWKVSFFRVSLRLFRRQALSSSSQLMTLL